jgi:hypothetical protein
MSLIYHLVAGIHNLSSGMRLIIYLLVHTETFFCFLFVVVLARSLSVASKRKDEPVLQSIVQSFSKTLLQYFDWVPKGHEKMDIARCAYYGSVIGELQKMLFEGTFRIYEIL